MAAHVVHDLRLASRRLLTAPGFSLTVIFTMALVIGANMTIYSLMNATVFRQVSAPAPHRLVAVSAVDTRSSALGLFYLDTFTSYRAVQQSFSTVALYANGFFRVRTRTGSFDLNVEGVSPEYLEMMGARIAQGRWLAESDNGPKVSPLAAVITDRFWARAFGRANAVGETMTVDTRSVIIVGVLAPGFDGLQMDGGVDMFLPQRVPRELAGGASAAPRGRYVIGRLAPGVSLAQARAEFQSVWPALEAATRTTLPPSEQDALTSRAFLVESAATGFSVLGREWGPSFSVVLGLTMTLLGVSVVNLLGLMSARVLTRRHEIAMCLTLGASRWRVLRQLLSEGVLLGLCAVLLALPMAWWGSAVLETMLTVARATPLFKPLTPDLNVVLTGVGTAITMGLAIGLWPAWGASRTRVAETLLPGRSVVRSFSRPARKALIAQIALSMVLLGAAGLFVIMLSNLRRNDATFRGRDVVWTRLATLPGQRLTLHGPDYLRALYDRLSAVPGAEGVALNVFFPAYVGFRAGIPYDQFADAHAAEPTPISGLTELVSPGFFRFFGIAQAAGRDFTWDDDHDAPKVAVVSRSLAQRVFGGDALGRRLTVQSGSAVTVVEIVGIAADAPIGSIRQPDLPVVYRPMLQEPARAQFPLAHLAHRGDRRAAREAYTAAVESLGRHYVSGLFTLEQWLDNATLQERLMTTVALFSALLALLLATLGVYASLAYAVASSTREIGVRMALGASRKAVLWMSVRDGLAVVVPGVVIGILCTAGAATVVRAQLYGVSPTDPAALAIAALIFLVTGVVAALVPGLRASRTDPMAALRHE